MSDPILVRGHSSRAAIRELQRLLNRKGAYPALPEDGLFDDQTEAAVRHFQWTHDLLPDGQVGNHTWATLRSAPDSPPHPPSTHPILGYGSTHAAVYELQVRLNIASVRLSLVVDGVFGGKTLKAVQQFQWRTNLPIHGTVDHTTWATLLDAMPAAVNHRSTAIALDHNNLSLQAIAEMDAETWKQLTESSTALSADPDEGLDRDKPKSLNTLDELFPPIVAETAENRSSSAAITTALPQVDPDVKHPLLRRGDRESAEDSNGAVHTLQRLLQQKVNPRLEVNGNFDDRTYRTVIHFQRLHHLIPTGEVNEVTWKKLLQPVMEPSVTEHVAVSDRAGEAPPPWSEAAITTGQPPLRRLFFPQWRGPRTPKGRPYLIPEVREPEGQQGPIHELQTLLTASDIPGLAIDGYFGYGTFQAVKSFQNQQGLILTDGRVGDETWDRLLELAMGQPVPLPNSAPNAAITLATLGKYYDPKNYPHQTSAFLWLQSQIPPEIFNTFVAYWRNPN
ncbi:peptidoglycan-binding domain-containing protein [Pantanalinema rosaneae CENA516]|uniref:peptidoglycan-binding domain-containing protein n=1 Tax=Pantanalinema rosaneae TaxID=1620701 RepID=UPI003D6ECEA7